MLIQVQQMVLKSSGQIFWSFDMANPTLAAQKAVIIPALKTASQSYILGDNATVGRYEQFCIQQLVILSVDANARGLTNRSLYVAHLFTWLESIMTYTNTTALAIQAAPDEPTLSSTIWDYAQFNATDPLITVPAALAIID